MGVKNMDRSPDSTSLDEFASFGELLKFLRRRERLTQLELSISVGYSEAQISRLEKNQRLPDITALKALFIPALHLQDEPQLVARFLELAQSARQQDAPAPGMPPYKGLLFFDEADADLFFGREILTARLAEHINDLVMGGASRFLAVVGASGSGKSSLVRAGLAVALRRAGWQVQVFTPTANPMRRLAENLDTGRSNGNGGTLLLVDQFEEVFTLCHDEQERTAFIEKLIGSTQGLMNKTTVVIALRADFYSHCAQYPLLREAVSAEQEYIGQMTTEELHRAIGEPARQGDWEFEPGLVEVLLQDLSTRGAHEPEPGALPLLSHALLATWERRCGRTMTLEGYHASGGVRGAIAETAENVFADQLNQAQQEMARDVFLRLTELGEGTEDTRRRASLNELVRRSEEATQLRGVLNTLAEARLITLNEDNAEVAHEALIREWQRLHEWLAQDREGLLLHRHLTESAYGWEKRNHDAAELYRGARLAQAREWASANGEKMNAPERLFLAAAIELEEHDAFEREAQRQRELEAAQKLAETEHRSAKQLRRGAFFLAGVLLFAFVAALTAGFLANRNSSLALQNASVAETAQAASTQAITNFTRSDAQRLAAEANNLMPGNEDPNLIALLAIRSLHLQYTPAGDKALTNLTNLLAPPRVLKGPTDDALDIAISPDGKYVVASSADRNVYLWDFATGEVIRVFRGHTAEATGVAFSPDGKFIAVGSYDRTVRLWEVANGQTLKVFNGQSDKIEFVTFSPDGRYILATGWGEARVWEIATGKAVHIISAKPGYVFFRARYSPDGKYFAMATQDKTARLYDATSGQQVRTFEHPDWVVAVAFSPDGKMLATISNDLKARLWDLATGQVLREFVGHQDTFNDVRFSPDGHFLLTGSLDHTARLWDIATGKTLRVFGGHTTVVQAALFSPDGKYVVMNNRDDVEIWSQQTFPGGMVFIGHYQPVRTASFSPDGRQVVTASNDHTARIWDAVSGQTLMVLQGHIAEVTDAVFSPDGRMVLTGGRDRTARLWDASTGSEIRRFEGHTDELTKVIFSPDGKYIITTSDDGTARVWETQTGKLIVTYTNQSSGQVIRAAFSPDGKTVATTGEDRTARIWDPMTGKDLMVFKGHTDIVTSVVFSPDGNYLLTASWDGTARLWDVASGKEIRQFLGHTGTVFGAAYSPDGKYVLTSGADRTARLWDVQTGQELRRFSSHTDEVRYVSFSPDGKYILTASQDGTARTWLIDLDNAIRAVCSVLTRDLTPEERTKFDIPDQGPICPAQ